MELTRGDGGCGAVLSGAVLFRGERRGEHGRARERAGVSGEERSAVGSCRRDRRAQGRPGLPRGVRRRRMAATRRACPDAVGRGAARRGAGQTRELG